MKKNRYFLGRFNLFERRLEKHLIRRMAENLELDLIFGSNRDASMTLPPISDALLPRNLRLRPYQKEGSDW